MVVIVAGLSVVVVVSDYMNRFDIPHNLLQMTGRAGSTWVWMLCVHALLCQHHNMKIKWMQLKYYYSIQLNQIVIIILYHHIHYVVSNHVVVAIMIIIMITIPTTTINTHLILRGNELVNHLPCGKRNRNGKQHVQNHDINVKESMREENLCS